MNIYHYNPITGEFLSVGLADPNPLEPGKFLIPAHATEIEPPVTSEKQVAVWKGSAWGVEEDNREEVLYKTTTGEEIKISEIGPLPWDCTRTPRPSEFYFWDGQCWVLNFNKACEAKCQEIASARYASEISGITVDNIKIKTDRESQALITGAVLQALQDPAYSCQWKTEAGFVSLTAEQIQGVAVAVRQHVQGCFDREAVLTELVKAATTLEELEQIKW